METIDIHTHGIGGYDTKTTDVEHIFGIADIQGSYGVKKILPAIYPAPVEEMRGHMMTVKRAMEIQREENGRQKAQVMKRRTDGVNIVSFIPASESQITGINLEGPFLNPSRCGALDPSSFLNPTIYNLEMLLDGFEDIVKIITIAPELDGAINLIKAIADMGIIVSMGHSDATYGEAEAGFNAGAKGITHIFNAMRGLHHREPGIAGFGLTNRHVYIEVIADPYHLHPETIKLIFSAKDPEKIIIISDTVGDTLKNEPSLNKLEGEEPRRNKEHEYHPSPVPVSFAGQAVSSSSSDRGMRLPSSRTSIDLLTENSKLKTVLYAVTDAQGMLCGGSMTIIESAGRLVQMGYKKNIIANCISRNPEKYLKDRQ